MLLISGVITELRIALETNANEVKLLTFIDERLSCLRACYRQRQNEFTEETVSFLKSLAPVQEALRDLAEAVEETEWVRTRDDAQELAARFMELKDRLTPHLVAKRAEKEIRELVERTKSLPFLAIVAEEAEFRRRRVQLESAARPCHRCGAKMALRESQNGYFWGCGTFPQCFGKRWLSHDEAKCLFPT
ncbi:MAG: topoisomerase DNA-binding C4 zinc finger domain-containing protein [Candidatus Accumulibacter sp.]|jgi:hypothetical protein|nr:topoisomerase DNA-binding C4 zinc finger domain-containing protein [Accumulibacter sp.]